MSNSMIKSLANKSGKSIETVEKKWKESKQFMLDTDYKESDDNFYPILVSVVKKRLGLSESFLTFKEFKNLK